MPNDAIVANKFVTFSIAPSFGVEISLSAIEPYTIRRSGTAPTTGIWQYSINGTDFFNVGTTIVWGISGTGNTTTMPSIDLSGISDLQNLTAGTTVTFRVINWGGTAAGGTWYVDDMSGNDLIVRGKIIQ